jgi:patatin-like phospholipase/acyl hydrolase
MLSPIVDGGGIRGLSSLLVLQTIMHRIQVEEKLQSPPFPCEYFDLIGGTGTGGYVAIRQIYLPLHTDE